MSEYRRPYLTLPPRDERLRRVREIRQSRGVPIGECRLSLIQIYFGARAEYDEMTYRETLGLIEEDEREGR